MRKNRSKLRRYLRQNHKAAAHRADDANKFLEIELHPAAPAAPATVAGSQSAVIDIIGLLPVAFQLCCAGDGSCL